MKAKRQVYLHVGYDKTGTTSIQRTLFSNRGLLRSDGILYPSMSPNHFRLVFAISDPPPVFRPGHLRLGVDTREAWFEKRSEVVGQLEELKQHQYEKLVLSSESFCTLDEANQRSLRDFASENGESLSVIMYLREPVAWLTSRFLQSVRGGATLEEAMKDCSVGIEKYRSRLELFDHVFGAENIDVRLFERAVRNDDGLVGDFLAAIDARTDLLGKMDVKRANAGSNAEQALIFDAINRSRPKIVDGKLNPERDRKIVGRLSHIEGTKLDISSSLVDNFGSELTALYAWVARRVPQTAELYSLKRASSRSRNSLDEGAALKSAFDQICESFNDLGVQATKLAVEKAYWKAAYHVEIGKGAVARDQCINALALDPANARIKNLMRKIDLEK